MITLSIAAVIVLLIAIVHPTAFVLCGLALLIGFMIGINAEAYMRDRKKENATDE